MSVFQQILLKTIGAYVLLFYCAGDVFATDVVATNELTVTICRKNYYISKCGSSIIGTNLLKGFSCENCEDAVNYYDYSEQNNVENLRKFFNSCSANAGPQYLAYENYEGQSSLTSNDVFCNQRGAFLQNICMPPQNTSSEFFTCLPCPDNGVTDTPSTMKRVTQDGEFVLAWENFHTIADCYKDSFEDSTGKYVYANANNISQTEKCYYVTEIKGDSLVSEITESGISYHMNSAVMPAEPEPAMY